MTNTDIVMKPKKYQPISDFKELIVSISFSMILASPSAIPAMAFHMCIHMAFDVA